MPSNELYLTVLPLIRVPTRPLGFFAPTAAAIEERLTLLPDRNFATEFYPDELPYYLGVLSRAAQILTGGHVVRYDIAEEDGHDGRKIVKVVQHVR